MRGARRHALLAGLLAAVVSLNGCAIVLGNEFPGEGWDDNFDREFKEETSSDKALSRRIQDALNEDEQTRRAGLEISSRDGEVLVYGRTGDADVVEHALRVVESVDGVEQVTSRIELTHSPRKADQ